MGFAIDGGKRLKVLINDSLNKSRVNTQGKVLAPTIMTEVIEQAIQAMKVKIRKTNTEISHDAFSSVMGDASHL